MNCVLTEPLDEINNRIGVNTKISGRIHQVRAAAGPSVSLHDAFPAEVETSSRR
jgi:hypothetical protein